MIEAIEQETTIDLPRIIAFSKDKPFCWSLFPEMLERIGTFAEKYCPDTIPSVLVASVMQDFTKLQPGFFIVGAIEDWKIVGHLLACISVPGWSNQRRCLILQYELDEGLPIGLLRAGLDLVDDWGKTQYCSKVIAETKTEEAARAFSTFYGFKVEMTQVERAL